ncbi:SAM-dependent methyltransferase [Novosphingobium sp. TCA1]|uniref:SAM-dependent methyltransferase n=1 Tax=Novosphingobium sp. TCA1 TaxID=2682474 RepID=UPI00130C3971|nr:SAM-dependent methyltransferase [Novosphingobium sp. TCA1]GFE75078.1 hypothetical protein NTCA1_27270 [Novosphingobium sp. TCA1]
MHYSLGLPGAPVWPVVSIVGALGQDLVGQDLAGQDPRSRSLTDRLALLHRRKRRAVRIVDVNCRDGAMLIHAAREARKLGFLSIECLGVDEDAELIDDARDRAHLVTDSAIGLDFEVAAPLARLQAEADFPADIVLYREAPGLSQAFRDALRRAGDVALGGTS